MRKLIKESEFDAVSIRGVKAKLETEKVHKANTNNFFMLNSLLNGGIGKIPTKFNRLQTLLNC